MEMNTFFRLCVYLCLIMLIFTLSVNLASSLSLFSSSSLSGSTDTSNIVVSVDNILKSLTSFEGTVNYIWLLFITLGGIGSFLGARMYGSTSIIGIYLFAAVFWTSYMRCLNIINIAKFIPNELLIIITAGVSFIWIAAIISMITYTS